MARRLEVYKCCLVTILGLAIYACCAYFMSINKRLNWDEQTDSVYQGSHNHRQQGESSILQQITARNSKQGYYQDGDQSSILQKESEMKPARKEKSRHWAGVHVAVVACGDRMNDALVMLKSVALFSKAPLVFHIFTEWILQEQFKERLDLWPRNYRERIEYHIYNLSFPVYETNNQKHTWEYLFKPCASQRLFIENLLPDVDSLLYVDTDILFLSPVEELWSHFARFNSSQMVAAAWAHQNTSVSWYSNNARHPYYGPTEIRKLAGDYPHPLLFVVLHKPVQVNTRYLNNNEYDTMTIFADSAGSGHISLCNGLNSGVMLMNLTRLRASEWGSSMLIYHQQYLLKISLGDQDLVNIYFHFHPEEVYVLNCAWNFRTDDCRDNNRCESAEESGALALHGTRRSWHHQQPVFMAIFRAFEEFDMTDSIEHILLENLHKYIKSSGDASTGMICKKLRAGVFTDQIREFTKASKMI